MVCLSNICINTLHKGDDDEYNNNNNNNNNKVVTFRVPLSISPRIPAKHNLGNTALWTETFWLTLSSEQQSADDQVAVRHDQWTTTCLVPLDIYSGSIFSARERRESSAARSVRATVCTLIASHAERNGEGTQVFFPHFTSFVLPRKNRDWSADIMNTLRLERPIRWGSILGRRERFFSLQSIQLDSEVHPASYSGFNHLHGVFWLRIRGAKPPPSKDLMAWCLMKFNTNFTFISSRSLLRASPSQFNKYFNVDYIWANLPGNVNAHFVSANLSFLQSFFSEF